jgi:L-malate glycosyltransferase
MIAMQASSSPTGTAAGAGLPPVLFLGDHFGYPSGVVHGVTTYFLHVLPALKAAGLDVTACFLREPHPAAAALRETGPQPIFLSARKMNPFVVFRVAAVARQRGCRIIHAGGIKATLVARIVATMVNAQAIVHVHDFNYPSRAVGALHRWFSRRTDIGLCVSRAVQEVAVTGYHVPAPQCRVVYNGVPLAAVRRIRPDARRLLRAELGIGEDTGVITMIARMHPVKGHQDMLQIMNAIVRSSPSALLVLVGDGPERSACEALVATLGLKSNVKFLGHRTDIPELLAASDVVVAPSQSEGLGLTAVEALAAGRPVVAYAVGGLREVVTDASDGRLIAYGDRDAFATAVVELLADRQLREAYGRRGIVAAERFGIDSHIDALLGIYRELAARP